MIKEARGNFTDIRLMKVQESIACSESSVELDVSEDNDEDAQNQQPQQ